MTTLATTHRVGYLRFLSLLLSYLPAHLTYTADSGRWAKALLWLRSKYEDTYPDFFADMGFDDRPGAQPYSRDVSECLTRNQQGAVVEVMNPGYARLQIRREAQETLRKEHEKRVPPELAAIIRSLAEDLVARKLDLLTASE